MKNRNVSKICTSSSEDPYLPDPTFNGALSRTLNNALMKMRIIIFPPEFSVNYLCSTSHSIYVNFGVIKLKLDNETVNLEKDSAIIIAGNTHYSLNNMERDYAQVVIVEKDE